MVSGPAAAIALRCGQGTSTINLLAALVAARELQHCKPVKNRRINMNTSRLTLFRRARAVLWLATIGLVATTSDPLNAAIIGQWDFTNELSASVGVDLEYFDGPGGATQTNTQFGTTTSFGISNILGQAVNVMRVPKTTSAMGYVLNPNAAGNGGGALLNQYSVIFDIYFPSASAGKARCLMQIDEPFLNSNEGEFYVAAGNGLGTAAKPQGVVTPDAWHRLVITVDYAATPSRATKYIDGVKVGQETLIDTLDGRWALGTGRALLFTDNVGAFEVAYVNALQVHDTVLSPGYVAALGGPSGDAIPASVQPVAVVDALRPTANDAYVLPGTLIEVDIVPAAQAIPVALVQLKIDGASVTPAITYPSAGLMRVSYNPGILAPESVHNLRLNFVDPVVGTNVQQVDWSFRMCPYQLPVPDVANEGLLWLGFDESPSVDGGAVADRSPSHNHGILHLQPGAGDITVLGPVGNAVDLTANQSVPQNYFELTNGYGAVPNTFAAWVKVDPNFPAATRVGVILGNYPVANAINWEIHTSGRPRVYWGYNSGALLDWIVGDDLRSGQWEHIAFVREGSKGFSYYRNGRLTASVTNATPAVLPVESPYVGTDRRPSGFQAFQGGLDEVTLFSRSINSNEVFRLYTSQVTFPKFLFSTPPITRLRPMEGATELSASERIEVLVDESFSSNTVNFASVQLTLNGVPLTAQTVRSNQAVRIVGVPASPMTPLSTNVARLRFLDNALTPHETIRQWSFVTGPAPVITRFSAGMTVTAGEDVNLGVVAAGVKPLTYQWRLDGVALSGATNVLLSLPAVTLAQAGSYDVVVGSPSGSVISGGAQLVVVSGMPLSGLLDRITGYYPFEAQIDGYVSNLVHTAGFPGFPLDEAYLNGAEGPASAIIPPFTTSASKVLAGTGALDCDGVGDYAQILGNPLSMAQDWTVSAWFKPDTKGMGYSGATRAFIFETRGVYPVSFGLRAGTAGNSNFQLFSDYVTGTDPSRDFQVSNADVDRWHHIVIVYRSASAVLEGWLDGKLTHQIAVTGTLNPGYGGFNMGTYRSADSRWFKGQIDEVALWQRPLATLEITNLFAVGQQGQTLAARISQPGGASFTTNLMGYYPFDVQVGRVVSNGAPAVGSTEAFADDAVTLYGGSIDPAARIYPISHDAALVRAGQGALSCDGTNDYAQIIGNPVNPNQNWSVAAWFRPNTGGLGLSGAARYCLFETAGTTFPISFGLSAGSDPNYTAFVLNSQSTTVSPAVTNLVLNSEVDKWHHIVLTYDAAAGLLKGYLDGSETHSALLGAGTVLQSFTGFNIGTYRAADARWFKGSIDEVTIWQRKLSPAAVGQAYALGTANVPWLTSVPRVNSFAASASPTGGFELSWRSAPGLAYSIEASSDLSDWSTTIGTNIIATGGTMSITISPTQPPPANGCYDPALGSTAKRFYRVRWNP